jgi:uncharacterized membrane protein YbhN (UPF0104 family)
VRIEEFTAKGISWFRGKSSHSVFSNPKVRSWFWCAGLTLFLVGLYIALLEFPGNWESINSWAALFVLVLGVPLTFTIGSLELCIMARQLNTRLSFGTALRIVILGAAANILPIPGGLIARVAGLQAAGAGVKSGFTLMLCNTGLWVGVSCIVGGLSLLLGNKQELGVVLIITGACMTLGMFWAMLWQSSQFGFAFQATILKLLLVLTDGVRLWLCLQALNFPYAFTQTMVLVLASVLRNAVTVVPAGLGVGEVFSAILAPLAAMSAAGAFIATALNRILGFIVILPIAAVFAAADSRQAIQQNERNA